MITRRQACQAAIVSLALPIAACASTRGTVGLMPASNAIAFDISTADDASMLLFSYHAARSLSTRKLFSRVPLQPEDAETLQRLGDTFAPVAAAMESYLETNLAFDRRLLFALASFEGLDVDFPDEQLFEALAGFRPYYREFVAPQHRIWNAEFRDLVEGEISAHDAAMTAAVAHELESEWRTEPIKLVISPYASRAGAYTNSAFTVMSSTRRDYREHALEMVFHEAAHTSPVRDKLRPIANAALARRGLENDRFWHHLQFYAVGRATQSVLGADYVPYHVSTGLSARGGSKPFYEALDTVWDRHSALEERANAAIDLLAEANAA